MENLIIIEGKNKYQYNDLKSLVENFVDKNYYNMPNEERFKILEKKTVANTIFSNIKTVEIEKYPDDFEEDSFVLYNEISYILSMLKFNKLVLLERTDANVFGKYLNKDNIKDNYIIINKFANEILKKYLKEEYYG